jgi:RimJ/RimL family protein N-acetyltransferase
MNPYWVIRTGRLVLRPVQPADLPALAALKADPRVFAIMLGGVRGRAKAAEELAADIAAWAAHGYGSWAVRHRQNDAFLGLTALQERPDGRGVAVRFAFRPDLQGRGYAREAAGAALMFGHEQADLRRIVAVARESNYGSRLVLGGIGMQACEHFRRNGEPMVTYESVRDRPLFPRILVGA